MPRQRWSSVLRGGVAAISCMPVQAGAARNHRARPTQVPAQARAPRAMNCTAMETGGQIPLVGPRVPAQAWASRSGRCTAWVARNHVTMETRARRTHHLPVAQTWTTRGTHGGVDGPPTKARTRWSVGAHCSVSSLRAPRHHVDAGCAQLWLALAFWRRTERLKGVVRAAVAAATSRDR